MSANPPPFQEAAFNQWFEEHQPIYRINREVSDNGQAAIPGLTRRQIVAVKQQLRDAFVAGAHAALNQVERILQEGMK